MRISTNVNICTSIRLITKRSVSGHNLHWLAGLAVRLQSNTMDTSNNHLLASIMAKQLYAAHARQNSN
jgi:hypothetical protein